jgi:hypothetical protein
MGSLAAAVPQRQSYPIGTIKKEVKVFIKAIPNM